MPIFSYVAVVIDTDGSAFITKAEFDSLKNNFQAQIDNYNSSIDSKIDGAIAAYLAGVKVAEHETEWDFSFSSEDFMASRFIQETGANSLDCGAKGLGWSFTGAWDDQNGYPNVDYFLDYTIALSKQAKFWTFQQDIFTEHYKWSGVPTGPSTEVKTRKWKGYSTYWVVTSFTKGGTLPFVVLPLEQEQLLFTNQDYDNGERSRVQRQANVQLKWEDKRWIWKTSIGYNCPTEEECTNVINSWRVRGENNLFNTTDYEPDQSELPIYINPYAHEVQGYIKWGRVKLYIERIDLPSGLPYTQNAVYAAAPQIYTSYQEGDSKEALDPRINGVKQTMDLPNIGDRALFFESPAHLDRCSFGFSVYSRKISSSSPLQLRKYFNVDNYKIIAEIYDQEDSLIKTITLYDNGHVADPEYVRDTLW